LLWKCVAMEGREPVLGPANTRFNDYVGTVAALAGRRSPALIRARADRVPTIFFTASNGRL
jgi:hypothetical protein